MKKKNKKLVNRITLGFLGIVLIVLGVASLNTGNLHYSNYRGAPVFAPFVILVGSLLIFLVSFKWKKLSKIK